ncbi:hypothetical protein FDECE_5681 [Fusarium decemcellulare]|nr:hypothetical protein FDECE_5681 [Fusarium decemcellulare]
MYRSAVFLALGALSSPAAAAWLRSFPDSTWTPPRQTGGLGQEAGEQAQIDLGWSPVPTNAPKLSGAMDMGFALGRRALDSQTCGFGADGNSFTCISSDATCAYSDDYVGCCESGRSCNMVKTTCIDFDASSSGACAFLEDFHTLCCGSSQLPACYTYVGTTSGDEYTLLACSVTSGSAALIFSDPLATGDESTSTDDDESTSTDDGGASSTDDASSTADDSSATTTEASPSSSSSNDNDDDGGSSTNVGAIAGGVVGGVAAIGIVGLAAFLLLRRRNNNKKPAPVAAGANGQMPPQMAQNPQNPQSPGQSFVPSSPSNAAYPSGVPSNYQPGYQQAYDPNMAAAAYSQQTYSPQPGSGYGPYSPQQQGSFQGQYPPQQGFGQQNQYPAQYGAAGYQAPSSVSPPPQVTPSPGPHDGTEALVGGHGHTPVQHQHSPGHQAQELPAVNPIGNENNRAELG